MALFLTATYLYSPRWILTITRSILLFHLLPSPILLVLPDHHPWKFLACQTLKSHFSTSRRELRKIYLHILHTRMRSSTTPSTTSSTLLEGHETLGKFSAPNVAPNTATPLLNCILVTVLHVLSSGCNSRNLMRKGTPQGI